MSQTHYEDVKRRRNAISEVVTRLLLAGQTDLAKELAETDWRHAWTRVCARRIPFQPPAGCRA